MMSESRGPVRLGTKRDHVNTNSNTNNNNNNRVSFASRPIVIGGSSSQDSSQTCQNGTYVQSHVEQRGKQKEFFVCIRKPDIFPSLNVEHRDIYSEQLIRLDQGLDILDRNGLNYNLEIDINHETIFVAHMSKLLSKSGYFFDSVVNFRPNYDFENSRIEVKNPEITPDVFSSLLDLIYFRTVKTCRDGLSAIGRAAQILDMAEVVKACQELHDPASVRRKKEADPQQQQQQQPPQSNQHQLHLNPSPSHHGFAATPQTYPTNQPQHQMIANHAAAQLPPFPAAGYTSQQQSHVQQQVPPAHTQSHNSIGVAAGCGGQLPIHLLGPPPLPSPPFPPNAPHLPLPPPPPYQTPALPHHHHPLPRARKCRTKKCCQREKCNHCDASKASCTLCEESCRGKSQRALAAAEESCCTNEGDFHCENPPNDSRNVTEAACCGLPPLIEDGTPPCKSPLQLLFDAMEKGASEQFHEAYNKLMDNFVQISMSKDFLNLNHHQLSFILASDSLVVPDEMFVFRSALRWIQFDIIARLKHAAKVLKAVRFPLLSWEQLLEAQREPLLANDRGFHALLQPSLTFFQSGPEKAASSGYTKPRRRRFSNI